MKDNEPNPYEPSTDPGLSALPSERKLRHPTKLILAFELPGILLVLHGFAYLLNVPGAEVTVNEYGGMQPVAFTFFRMLATGGLLVPLVFGCWLSATSDSDAWKFGLFVGISYAIVSVMWWILIAMGVSMRFI